MKALFDTNTYLVVHTAEEYTKIDSGVWSVTSGGSTFQMDMSGTDVATGDAPDVLEGFTYYDPNTQSFGDYLLSLDAAVALKKACDMALSTGEADSAADLLVALSKVTTVPNGTSMAKLFGAAMQLGVPPNSVRWIWEYPKWVDQLESALARGSYDGVKGVLLTMPAGKMTAGEEAIALQALDVISLRLVDLYSGVVTLPALTQDMIDEALNRPLP